MAYDEGLAERVREVLADNPNIKEKKMFGGIAFMLGGNMACGLIKEDLLVRIGPEKYEKALVQKGAIEMDFTGRPSKGTVLVSAEGYEDDKKLIAWIKQGVDYARSLPAK
jgi:TfoX/Sxy family transcriptional regulator of competence genes